MAFREVRVYEIREVLRLWLAGEGLRSVERLSQVDRKTVRRYVDAAVGLGLDRDGGGVGAADRRVHRVGGGGGAPASGRRPRRGVAAAGRPITMSVAGWVAEDLTAVKVHELLERRGVVVPLRTVQRYVLTVCGRGRGRGPTVRIADGEPGDELQVDFGRMGFIVDAAAGAGWCRR